ncbi:MAG: PIN domain-containing protein [Thermoanaerobaculia bacterium]
MAASEGPIVLLDTNALLALAWPNHQFHGIVVERLDRRPVPRWATCLLTELGFIRLSLNPAIFNVRKEPGEVLDVLNRLTADEQHTYVDVLPPIAELDATMRRLLGHQQITDAYLVAVAEANDATLLTLDRRLITSAVARDRVETLVP